MLRPARAGVFAYAFADRVRLLVRTGIFYLGLATTLVPMGVAAGSVGALVNEHRSTVVLIGGLVMIALGVTQIVGFGFGSNTAQRLSGKVKISSSLSVYLLGSVYGLAGFCAGPLLGSVLAMAMTGSSPAYGGLLLAIYALGMALPLFVIAALWDRFDLGRRRWLRGRVLHMGPLQVHSTTLLSGLFFIALGTLFMTTDGTGSLGGIVGIDGQFAAQAWAQEIADTVSDQFVLAVVAVTVAVALAWRLSTTRRTNRAPTGDDPAHDHTRSGTSRPHTKPTPRSSEPQIRTTIDPSKPAEVHCVRRVGWRQRHAARKSRRECTDRPAPRQSPCSAVPPTRHRTFRCARGDGVNDAPVTSSLHSMDICNDSPVTASRSDFYDAVASTGKAMAHGKRLELLELLAQGERPVQELARAAELKLTTASAQLKVLHQAGLVATRSQGPRILYRLTDDDVAGLLSVLCQFADSHRADVATVRRSYLDTAGIRLVGRDELMQAAADGTALVLDVRPAEEYAAGHVPGAVSIPVEQLADRLAEVPIDTEVVAYCRGRYCVLSYDAVRLLHASGRNAALAEDGIVEWRRDGLPVTAA